jgi:hypothetical protein
MINAILIIGPESSGTRMLTRMFYESGWFGDYDHGQRLDTVIRQEESFRILRGADKFVIRRSVPHKKEYPDVEFINNLVADAGFELLWLIAKRDPMCNAKSKVRQGHQTNLKSAILAVQSELDFIEISEQYMTRFKYVDVSGVMKDPYLIENYIGSIKLSDKAFEVIYDAEKKYEKENDN